MAPVLLLVSIFFFFWFHIDIAQATFPHCCQPKKWQADITEYWDWAPSDTVYTKKFYEDDIKQSILTVVTTKAFNGTELDQYNYLLHQEGSQIVSYTYRSAKKQCSTYAYAGTWNETANNCIPKDAIYTGPARMGVTASGGHLDVHSFWWIPYAHPYEKISYKRFVSADCTRVLDVYHGVDTTVKPAAPVLISGYYLNVQTYISDESVFEIPTYCPSP